MEINFEKIDKLKINVSRRKKFLAVGRLTKQKDPLLVIKAFSTTKFVNSATLTIVGDGPLHKEVSNLCDNISSKSQINRISHCKDIFSLMQAHDTLVCTSQWEGLPNVVMEALQAGLHVVVPTYCLGAVELIKGLENTSTFDNIDALKLRLKLIPRLHSVFLRYTELLILHHKH